MLIPIIPPEKVETVEKKIKKEKVVPIFKEEGEEDKLTQIWGEIIGHEGETEGKEEAILNRMLAEVEKEERRRKAEEKKRERKEGPIFMGPMVPRLDTSEKEHIHEKSIVPIRNGCCKGLCKDLNDEIFEKEESLGATIPTFVKGAGVHYKGFPSIPYIIEALKDYRYLLDKNNVCKCYEETEKIESPLPVIGGKPEKLISAKTGKPIILGPSIPRFQLPIKQIHIAHRKEKPTVPTHDGCCMEACSILTNMINSMEDRLDQMELRGGKEFAIFSRTARYEALSFKSTALQDYRSKLTKKGVCECIK